MNKLSDSIKEQKKRLRQLKVTIPKDTTLEVILGKDIKIIEDFLEDSMLEAGRKCLTHQTKDARNTPL